MAILKEEQYQKIVNFVNKKNAVTVDELCGKFYISRSIVSRDLQRLNHSGKFIKTHGGQAVPNSFRLLGEPSFPFRKKQLMEEKQRIVRKAVDYIGLGETVILDSGTPTLWLADFLDEKENLSVLTNDLLLALELLNHENIDVNMLGGNCGEGILTQWCVNEPASQEYLCGSIFLLVLMQLMAMGV